MSDDVPKARANLHYAKERQQARAAEFWQRTMDAGRLQRQAGKQMQAGEREAGVKRPRLRPKM
jgi:hypothetical protein